MRDSLLLKLTYNEQYQKIQLLAAKLITKMSNDNKWLMLQWNVHKWWQEIWANAHEMRESL